LSQLAIESHDQKLLFISHYTRYIDESISMYCLDITVAKVIDFISQSIAAITHYKRCRHKHRHTHTGLQYLETPSADKNGQWALAKNVEKRKEYLLLHHYYIVMSDIIMKQECHFSTESQPQIESRDTSTDMSPQETICCQWLSKLSKQGIGSRKRSCICPMHAV